MKKCVQLIALFIALVMGVGVLSFRLMPVSTASSASLSEEKISTELASKFAQAEDDCTVTAMVWFSDIDLSAAEQAGINAVEAVSAEKEATFNLQAENMQSIEEVQAYIQAKRAATAELYITHNQQLAEKLFSENEIVCVLGETIDKRYQGTTVLDQTAACIRVGDIAHLLVGDVEELRQLLPVGSCLIQHDNELRVGQHGAGLHGIQQVLHILGDSGGVGISLAELPPCGVEESGAELVLKHHMGSFSMFLLFILCFLRF